jgi:uncharacterized protein involved in exopolysaccharide biosynthesis
MSGPLGEFGQYLQAVTRRWWLVALTVVLAVGGAYVAIGRAPARYSASTTLMLVAPVVVAAPPAVVTPGEGAGAPIRPSLTTVANDAINLITSRPVADRVTQRLNLSGPSVVRRNVTATQVRGTSLIRVTATARERQRAADIANTVAEEFITYFRETNRGGVTEARRFVEQQLARSRTQLEAVERRLQALQESRGAPIPMTAASTAMGAVDAARREYDAATTTRREVEARLASARGRLQRENPLMMASRSTIDNPFFRQIQTHMVELELSRANLAQIYTPQHPRMDQINREIADVRGRLMREARTSISEEVTQNNPTHARLMTDMVTLEVDQAATSARAQAMLQTLQRRQSEMNSMPSLLADTTRLTREASIQEANYRALSARYQDLLLRENEAGFYPAAMQIIEPATVPSRVASTFPRVAAAAAGAGLILGFIIALFLEALDDRVRSAQDAERVLGVPVLAEIPTHGQREKTVPASAMFTILLVIGLGVAVSAVIRGYFAPTASAAVMSVRSVAATVSAWTVKPQPQVGFIGLAGDDR